MTERFELSCLDDREIFTTSNHIKLFEVFRKFFKYFPVKFFLSKIMTLN